MTYDLGRYEMKYAVPSRLRDRVLELVDPYVIPDPWARALPDRPGRGYVVTSLYFDTPDLRDYTARLAEANIRDRLRVRTYGHASLQDPVFLENKRKLDDRVIKARVKVGLGPDWADHPDPHPWRHIPVTPMNRSGLQAFAGPVDGVGRVPRTLVRYAREVFVGRDASDPKLRLTLDHDITGAVVDDARALRAPTPIELIPPEFMVMELKFDRMPPSWMRRLTQVLHLRAAPISKFGLSICKGYRNRPAELRYLSFAWVGRTFPHLEAA